MFRIFTVLPELLFLAPVSALLIRVALLAILGYAGWQHLSKPQALQKIWGALELIAGVFLFVGAWTQVIAILVFVGILCSFFWPWMRIYSKSTLLLALVMCASLVMTGAGNVAFDLPL